MSTPHRLVMTSDVRVLLLYSLESTASTQCAVQRCTVYIEAKRRGDCTLYVINCIS